MDVWLLLQLADAAFPTGGFAHSGGLEAAAQLGEIAGPADLGRFLDAALWQAGHAALPFVRAAHDAPDDLADIDAACDVFLSGHVANRASRTQGRAFLATCARVFPDPRVRAFDAGARAGRLAGHHAPAFGASLAALGASRRDALVLHLHLALRGVASAAVRLGLAGPHEAQRLQHHRAPLLDRILATCEPLDLADAAQPAPLLDLFQSTHDRLYARLFQS